MSISEKTGGTRGSDMYGWGQWVNGPGALDGLSRYCCSWYSGTVPVSPWLRAW